MENRVWFGVSLVRGQERVGASGIADPPHTLKIHSVVMQKLHYWYKKKPQTDPSAFLNVSFILSLILKNSLLFLIPD